MRIFNFFPVTLYVQETFGDLLYPQCPCCILSFLQKHFFCISIPFSLNAPAVFPFFFGIIVLAGTQDAHPVVFLPIPSKHY
jgi:hypothetical protein